MTLSFLPKLAADAAEPDESLLRQLATYWPCALLVLDRELRVLWGNDRAAALIGAGQPPVRGTPWAGLGLPWPLGADRLERLAAGDRERLPAASITAPEGGPRTYTAQLTPLKDAWGELTAILCDFEEVTDPATLESVSNQRQLELALESAHGGMWRWNLVSGEQTYTDYYYRILGVEPEQGRRERSFWSDRLHPDDRARICDTIQRLIDGETGSYETEYRLRHANGTWRWIHDCGRVAERDAEGKATVMVGFLVDVTERVLTQEALRRSEFRYRRIATLTPGYIFEYRLDEAGKPQPVWHGDGLREIFGCAFEEIQRRGGWEAFIDPEWAPITAARLAGVIQGVPQRGEMRMRRIDGQTLWLYVSIMPVRDHETGVVQGIIGSAHDITERKIAEQELRKSEAVLRAVTGNTPDWLFLIDRSYRVEFMNRAFGEHEPESVKGRSLLELVPASCRTDLEALYRHVLETHQPARFDVRLKSASGGSVHHEHRIVPVIESGLVRWLTVAVTDVTERKSTEFALRTQARILETMREGVVLVDSRRRIKLTNPTFDSMFGYEADELLGQSVKPLYVMPRKQRRWLSYSLRESTDVATVLPLGVQCVRRDGTRVEASCVITPITIGDTNYWLAVLNDITERKQLEREIIEIASREQQRIGIDLHDGLGQELTGIALMLRGIVAELRGNDPQKVRQEVEDVISIVNNAIESTRALARGLSPVTAERGGLAAALRSLAERARERYEVRVEFHGDSDAPSLPEATATHLYRIAQEALTNVIRHSQATRVTITLENSGEELHLRIQDNGCGFARALLEGSDGLGLKIMRYRARIVGGDLTFDSVPGGGVTVRCSCPLPPATSIRLGGRRRARVVH